MNLNHLMSFVLALVRRKVGCKSKLLHYERGEIREIGKRWPWEGEEGVEKGGKGHIMIIQMLRI
jgi:hypothetical protein